VGGLILAEPHISGRRRLIGPLLLACAGSLGALLSFGMEPMVGRAILPYFGSAAHVWNTCLMVFQGLLLLGYGYARFVAPRLGGWHLAVCLLALVQLPLGFTAVPAADAPVLQIIAQLLLHVGLPFAVLTTTAVVVQQWWTTARTAAPGEPDVLYALSNAGSLLSLVAYPLVIEPLVGLRTQQRVWSLLYMVYVVVLASAWWVARPRSSTGLQPRPATEKAAGDGGAAGPVLPVPRRDTLRWTLLGATASALLLGVTNLLAMEIGSFPLVWVVPLGLYLASFVVAFGERSARWAEHCGRLWPDAVLLCGALAASAGMLWVVPLLLLAFFVLCVAAHGEARRRKPDPSQLAHFYLALAVGGFFGGAAVTLFAPVLLPGLWEVPLALLALSLTLSWSRGLPDWRWWGRARLAIGGPRFAVVVAALLFGCGVTVIRADDDTRMSLRNFYGTYRVVDAVSRTGDPYRVLLHGQTVHGLEYLAPERRGRPLAYFHAGGALAQAVRQRRRPSRTAVVGLGAGSLAATLDGGEQLVFYEIDPDNEGIARRWFSFLSRSLSTPQVRVGDARLLLDSERAAGAPPYDLLVVDAFSGDGIPVHLLTREALAVYLARLADDGLLVLHLSNRYYDVRPTLRSSVLELGVAAVFVHTPAGDDVLEFPVDAMVIARNEDRLKPLLAQGWRLVGPQDGLRDQPGWTDDRSDMLRPLWAHFGVANTP